MMSEFGFVYDSSIIAPFSDPPVWPYTLDHGLPHRCIHTEQLCPTRSYPNVWELPLNELSIDVSLSRNAEMLVRFPSMIRHSSSIQHAADSACTLASNRPTLSRTCARAHTESRTSSITDETSLVRDRVSIDRWGSIATTRYLTTVIVYIYLGI
jgi:hypothetical protein